MSDTRNFAVELLSVVEKGVPGNFVTSQADEWHYHDLVGNRLYILSMPQVRAWFYELKQPLRPFKTRTHRGPNEGYHTWGLLVPVEDVMRAGSRVVMEVPLPDPPERRWVP